MDRMTPDAILNEIMRHDPDGKPTEPTQADYNAFNAWILSTYGANAWQDYQSGSWAATEDW
jgi:hypothetical protein